MRRFRSQQSAVSRAAHRDGSPRRDRRVSAVMATCAALALALGCTTVPTGSGDRGVSGVELLTGDALGVRSEPPDLVSRGEVLAVSAEMRRFLADNVDPKAGDAARLRQLIHALITSGTIGLEYDEKTRTAAETFRTRRGNCLSFSNLFVAMARQVGLEVRYQEVDIPPDWSRRDDLFILNRHVNVLADVAQTGQHVVDFNIANFQASYDRRPISDERALAHFYNNLAVEAMADRDSAAAFAYLRRAVVEGDDSFSPAWTSLGTLYLRAGRVAHAEAAFLQALEADADDLVAMSNLEGLYEQLGHDDEAAAMRRRVHRHRMGNPYYRFHLARQAIEEGDYQDAIDHLRYAVRKKRREAQFLYVLGLTYLLEGDRDAARRWLLRAREAASAGDDGTPAKIERLLDSAG